MDKERYKIPTWKYIVIFPFLSFILNLIFPIISLLYFPRIFTGFTSLIANWPSFVFGAFPSYTSIYGEKVYPASGMFSPGVLIINTIIWGAVGFIIRLARSDLSKNIKINKIIITCVISFLVAYFISVPFKKEVKENPFKFGGVKVVTLFEDTDIQGTKFLKGTKLEFTTPGKVTAAKLVKDQEIQGIYCAKSSSCPSVYFHSSGQLSSCDIGKEQEIQGIKFARGDTIEFYESGKIETVQLKCPSVIQGVPCLNSALVEFYESGRIKSATLSQDCEIKEKPYKSSDRLFFDEDGNVIRCENRY